MQIANIHRACAHSIAEGKSGRKMARETQCTVAAVVGSFLLWTNLYLLLRVILRPLRKSAATAEAACRIATVLHGFLLSGLGLASMFLLGPWPFDVDNLGKPNTHLHTDTVVLSLGYFLFDFAWCVWTRTEGPVMLAHHAVSIFGFAYVLLTGRYGCEATGVLGASELTNPLLQLRWFLRRGGMYSGVVERAVDWTFAALFISIRLGVGSAFFLFVLFPAPHVDTVVRLGSTGFYVISVVFSLQVALYMHKKYFPVAANGRKKST